jgi:hypothetical protein
VPRVRDAPPLSDDALLPSWTSWSPFSRRVYDCRTAKQRTRLRAASTVSYCTPVQSGSKCGSFQPPERRSLHAHHGGKSSRRVPDGPVAAPKNANHAGRSGILIRLIARHPSELPEHARRIGNIPSRALNEGDDIGEEEAYAEIQKQDRNSEATNSAEAGDKAREGEGLPAVPTGVPAEPWQRRLASWCLLLGRGSHQQPQVQRRWFRVVIE